MPTTPKVSTLNATSAEILNVIRANASPTYQDRIPIADGINIKEIGAALMSYEALRNEFLAALVNRIGRVLITSRSYQNPLRMFKKGILEYGETVEEIFVNIAQAHVFDPADAEDTLYKRMIPDVNAAFHTLNKKLFYGTTISNEQLRQAFLSMDGVTDLIGRIVDSLYSGSEVDEFIMMKEVIGNAISDNRMYPVTVPEANETNAKSIVTSIKAMSNSLTFPNSAYNPANVITHTPKNRQVLLIDAQLDAMIDVNVLASAFNMDKAEFMGRRVLVDNFGSATNVVAALVDEDFFMIFDNFIGFTENYNGKGLYWNYFYHTWKTFSNSPFANAVVFTTDSASITTVTVTPDNPSVKKGNSQQFDITLTATGPAPKNATWSITGNTSNNTVINSGGLVTIGTDETASTITVKATSSFDNTKSGSTTITVTA